MKAVPNGQELAHLSLTNVYVACSSVKIPQRYE